MQGLRSLHPRSCSWACSLIYPLVYTIVLSFADTNAKLEIVDWVGFENYTNLFTKDKEFLDPDPSPPTGAFVNNLKWVVPYTSLSLALGLLIAGVAARVRYEAFLRAIVFIPMAISATAVAIIWKFVLTRTPTSAR